MSNATQLAIVSGQLTGLATALTTYDAASLPTDIAAAKVTIFQTGEKVRKNCAMLRDALRGARLSNARLAIGALIDLSLVATPVPIEACALSVEALNSLGGYFDDYSSQGDQGLGSYRLLNTRFAVLQTMILAEPLIDLTALPLAA